MVQQNNAEIRPNGGYLGDGYSVRHCIPGNGFHQEVNIEFRPATTTETAVTKRQMRRLDERDDMAGIEKLGAEFMQKKLISWDLTSGETILPLTVDSLLLLEPHLSGSMFDAILGNVPAVAKKVQDDEKN